MSRRGSVVRRWRRGDPLEELAATVARGGILVIPTESSYGLAVDPRNALAVAKVYEVKGRVGDKALPVVVADLDQARALGVDVDDPAVQWAVRHWPAALTVIAPVAAPLPASAGRNRLAIRIPDHDLLRALLAKLGPLTATSANASGDDPLVVPEDVMELLFQQDAAVVDDGPLAGGAPSTVVSWRSGELRVVRPGRFPVARHGDDVAGIFSTDNVEITVKNSSE